MCAFTGILTGISMFPLSNNNTLKFSFCDSAAHFLTLHVVNYFIHYWAYLPDKSGPKDSFKMIPTKNQDKSWAS